jgi:photosynthetic reaction center cytochrome c subunit
MIRANRLTIALACVGLALTACGKSDVESVQHGYRGTGMAVIYDSARVEAQYAASKPPSVIPVASADGPTAGQVYQNVKVLDDLSVAEFARVMLAITEWVVPKDLPPEQGSCNYCHGGNLADDSKYQKVVSRRMLQMTRDINSQWKTHVAATGVTCYTCHRGNPVPSYAWFSNPGPGHQTGIIATRAEQNTPSLAAGLTSLPYDPFTPFLLDDQPIRVESRSMASGGNRASIKQAEWTYSLMVHMSNSLGVNCSFCHNTRAWGDWSQSSPQRVTAWHGIRMTRELNTDYMVSLTSVFPRHRLGVAGDVAKINCSTCHQGVYKPMFGAALAKDYPELRARKPAPVALPAEPAAEPAASAPVPVTAAVLR